MVFGCVRLSQSSSDYRGPSRKMTRGRQAEHRAQPVDCMKTSRRLSRRVIKHPIPACPVAAHSQQQEAAGSCLAHAEFADEPSVVCTTGFTELSREGDLPSRALAGNPQFGQDGNRSTGRGMPGPQSGGRAKDDASRGEGTPPTSDLAETRGMALTRMSSVFAPSVPFLRHHPEPNTRTGDPTGPWHLLLDFVH